MFEHMRLGPLLTQIVFFFFLFQKLTLVSLNVFDGN